jgi:hypothetical protein
MFASLFDPAHALRVSRVGPPSDRTDLDSVSRTIESFDRETLRTVRPPVHLLLVEDAIETNAADRKRFAQVAMGLKAPRLVFALVTASMLHRGTLKAVTWLAPPPPGHRVDAFASLAEARVWIESTIREPLPTILELAAQVGHRPWS